MGISLIKPGLAILKLMKRGNGLQENRYYLRTGHPVPMNRMETEAAQILIMIYIILHTLEIILIIPDTGMIIIVMIVHYILF